ncbi:flippase-like domain-containing protein [Halobaculum sp. CBA1158]|uniref:lysylphosphatidylglycerol synthase transmembrane domain-containing protein n=1 Tax=Halobaculum sp. CBA1158 TaxID=2904243 RepID=UPI001F15CADD|nr:lysylphosphatidylglycerol synthase transmembrane domain-containing protein [Halobaculum sp. CBA1158]UIO99623.1 flippase-like domain-containing protein [Halobaculum sp. CBA1158]
MDSDQLRATVLGFLGAFAVLGGLLYLVGVGDLLDVLRGASLEMVGFVVLATLGWLVAWSVALRTVLGVLGIRLSVVRSFLVFSGAMFSNNVTPFGQAGGEPITALLIATVADTEYERGLAAIASVDTLNFVPSITLALVGAAYFATETTFGTRLQFATGVVVALALLVPAIVYLGWRNRYALEHRAIAVFVPAIRRVARLLPVFSAPTEAAVESRIGHFFGAIERVAGDRTGIAVSLGASTLGWVLQMVALYLAFLAIGQPVPFSAMLFVVPMGAIAGVTPLPGGTGGIEAVLVAVLAALPSVSISASAALGAVVIYRGAVYWVPVIIGGTVVSVIGADSVS